MLIERATQPINQTAQVLRQALSRVEKVYTIGMTYENVISKSRSVFELFRQEITTINDAASPEEAREKSKQILKLLYAMGALERMKVDFFVEESNCMRNIIIDVYLNSKQ